MNKKIKNILNQARSYETDWDKTLPFTYRECERAVEITIEQTQAEFVKMIDEKLIMITDIRKYEKGYCWKLVIKELEELKSKILGVGKDGK